MSRSKQRSKCRRVGCLLCKPHKASGEPTIAVLRATVDDPLAIALEEDPHDYDDDWCPHCDRMVAIGHLFAHGCFGVGRIGTFSGTFSDPLVHRIPLPRAS